MKEQEQLYNQEIFFDNCSKLYLPGYWIMKNWVLLINLNLKNIKKVYLLLESQYLM